jgi:electron transport complex protein RnfB
VKTLIAGIPGTVSLADRIDAQLPQTQCTRCGFEGCRPYAEAVARGESPINRCPPGGRPVIDALSRLLGVRPVALDPDCGAESPPRVALIDEAECIGCAKCIDACPTDAIVGARKWMHTVIAADCSGCELCLPPCPVDCIDLVPHPALPDALLDGTAITRRAGRFRALFEARGARLERDRERRRAALAARLDQAGAGAGTP